MSPSIIQFQKGLFLFVFQRLYGTDVRGRSIRMVPLKPQMAAV
jgi:hypothetical protein